MANIQDVHQTFKIIEDLRKEIDEKNALHVNLVRLAGNQIRVICVCLGRQVLMFLPCPPPPFLPPIAASAEKELRLNSYDVVSSHLIPSCSLLVRQDQSDYGR